ncbi:K(+)/H(+) antiporter [Nowakowskiella sp. JEL0078]|nr:K(+)/H(+) antiporter [Nowakowskiella sp. JEL0078]
MGAIAEGTILAGSNPFADPLSLFLIQSILIILVARLLGVVLRYIRQPTVIAEVIGGILLGPSALGVCFVLLIALFNKILSTQQITAYKNTLFPASSLPSLSLVANIGLILFLFLVGLELDPRSLRENYKQSLVISFAGVVIPFAISVGASKILYDFVLVPDVNADILAHTLAAQKGTPLTTTVLALPPFSSFLVFTGVAMSITAFPVLARILAERKLLGTTVGTATLSAAAVGDATAWCLLVLVVALITNPSNSIMALYVFLVVVAWGIFLWFAIRPIFVWLVNQSQESESISQFAVFFTFGVVWISSWFTQIVGVHAIFGAFLVGLIVPHDHGFAIQLTEKVEDLVSIIFLPLYFAYSGLNTRIDELNDGFSWLMVLFVTAVACVGKVLGCGLSAKATGLNWRESWAVGVLMNTKGLVELIVLNLGLQGGVISPRVFTIMVMMALITTFTTVPLISFIYPPSHYANEASNRRKNISEKKDDDVSTKSFAEQQLRVLICLPNIQSVPAMMSITQMMQEKYQNVPESGIRKLLSIAALRLVPLGNNRTSTVMRAAESQQTVSFDPILNIFRTFGQLSRVGVTTDMVVCAQEEFTDNIILFAKERDVAMVVVPISSFQSSSLSSHFTSANVSSGSAISEEKFSALEIAVANATCSVAIFIDRGFGVSSANPSDISSNSESSNNTITFPGYNQQVFLVFAGGLDDREAARFVELLVAHPGLSITVFRLRVDVTKHEIKEEDTTIVLDVQNTGEDEDVLDDRVLESLARHKNVHVEELNASTVLSTFSAASKEKDVVESLGLSTGKAVVGLVKQSLLLRFGPKDLLVVGKQSFDGLGRSSRENASHSNGLRSWVESSACVGSAAVVTVAKGVSGRSLEYLS